MPAAPSRSERVLIIDDEPGILRATERVLSPTYLIATASRPSEALELVEECEHDLVICDIRMPEMDGFALVKMIRAKRPGVDVIFMTGSHTEPDAHLVRAIRSDAFYFIQKPFERQVLSTLVERCLELRRLRRAQRDHTARLERELAEAALFQRTMLGPERGRLHGIRLCARCQACTELGGDLYDFDATGDGRAAFIIADVRGHGASAALLTAVVKASFRSAAAEHYEPARIVSRLWEAVAPFGADRFVTTICGRFDPKSGTLEYINAGHPPGIAWAAAGAPVSIAPTAPIVCAAFEAGSWQTQCLKFPRGFAALLFTDGLCDSLGLSMTNTGTTLAGEIDPGEGAEEVIIDHVMGRVAASLKGRPAWDDITLLAISDDRE